jgi:hypothetical protein
MAIKHRMVRVNDENHPRRRDAMADMRTIIDSGAYWTRNETPPDVPAGTPVVAMGSRGGRGLFLHGIVDGEWEPTRESGPPYLHRISVAWADAIYEADPDVVAAEVERFNRRSWSRMKQSEYLAVLGHVLSAPPVVE